MTNSPQLARPARFGFNKFSLMLMSAFVIFGVNYILHSSAAVAGCAGTVINPGTDIAAAVSSAGAATTFCIRPGVYRSGIIAPKASDVLWGEPGAVISGSKALSGWMVSGTAWYVTGALPADYTDTNYSVCEDTAANLCNKAERVFINNLELTRVASPAGVTAGTFYSDYAANRIYVGTNPIGAAAEMSSARTAIASSNSNVTVRDLTVEKFATLAQRAAIEAGGLGWKIENNELRFNHGAGLKVLGGQALVTGNYVHHNGQTGLTCYNNTGTVIDKNELAYNTTDGFWINDGENGGIKVARTSMTITNNYVHDNQGLGIWADIDNKFVTISGNYVSNNYSDGIRYEISYDGTITGNTLVNNGFSRGRGTNDYLGNGGAITINTSARMLVEGNTLYDNDKGVGLSKANRGSGAYGLWDLTNVNVRGNTITLKAAAGQHGLIQYVGDNSYFTGKANTFSGNKYHLDSLASKHFQWLGALNTAAAWQGFGNDTAATGGSFDTVIPAAPGPPQLAVGPRSTATGTPLPSVSVSATPTAAAQIPGDINADQKVDVVDLSILLSHWGAAFTSCDFNNDGKVSVVDLSVLLSHWTN